MTTQDTENQAGSHEPTQAEVEAKVAAQNAEALGNASEEGLTATPAPTVDTPPVDAVVDTETKAEEPQDAAVEVA